MNEKDIEFLRAAIAAARRARENGNEPFGAVLVNESGEILLEAENTAATDGDCTGHAETNLAREASQRFDRPVLAKSTLYASAEPCAMCSGAIFWSGIGRVVFGLSARRVRQALPAENPQLLMPCRDVFAAGERTVAVEGPAPPATEDEIELLFKNQGG